MLLDRTESKNEITKELNNSKSIFVFAKHGVGKSALCTEISKTFPLTITVNHRNRRDLFEEGDIILKLKEQIDKKSFDLNIKTYNRFSKKNCLIIGIVSFLSYIENFELGISVNPLINLAIPIIAILKLIISVVISKNIRNQWKSYENGKSNILNFKKYIYYAIEKSPNLIININNLQVIDKTSFDFIIDLIRRHHIRFLLEYTEEEMDGLVYYNNNFTDILRDVHPIKLPWLPDKEVNELIHANISTDLREKCFNDFKKDGNLYPIVQNKVSELFLNLNAHELTILYVIDLFRNNLSYKELTKLFISVTKLDKKTTKKIIEKLQKREIIFTSKNKIHIANIQYSVNQTIKMSVFVQLKKMLEKNYKNTKLLEALIPLYITYDINGLVPFFDYIRSWLLQIADKDFAISLLNSICKKIDDSHSNNYKLILYIVDAYYSLALFQEAYEILNKYFKYDINFIIYKAMLLNRLDQHQESNELIYQINKSLSVQHKIILLNIEMLNYASLRNSQGIKSTYYKIMEIKEAHKFYEYNYALRNSHLAIKRKKAIENIKLSIRSFKSKHDTINFSRALISLSILYILEGKLYKAKKILFKVNSLSKHQPYELAVSYNNLATILMQENNYIGAENYLKDALELSFDLFDRLSIMGNLLTIKTLLQDYKEGELLAQKIREDIKQEPDKKLNSCLYDELAKFYKALGNKDLAKKYNDLSKKMLYEISLDKHTTNDAVTTPNGFIINQLAFWHFDLYKII